MKFLFIILFCLGTLFARANDCVPLTFKTISMLANNPISYETWKSELIKNNETPTLLESITSWNRHFMVMPLVCVYSNIKSLKATDRDILYDDTPYFWVGKVPAQIAKNPNDENSHAAILIMRPEHVLLVHPIGNEKTDCYYVETISYDEFCARTYAVYEPVPLGKIKWKSLLGIINTP